MSLITIRICEEADAKLMMKDGSFQDFIQMWSDQFPQVSPAKFTQIKRLKERLGCGIREAKQMVDAIPWTDDTVRFEIGDRIRIEKQYDQHNLYRKIAKDKWVCYGEIWPDTLPGWYLFPEKPKTCPYRFKNYGEF